MPFTYKNQNDLPIILIFVSKRQSIELHRYDPTPSTRYNKTILHFSNKNSIFIDATEFGDVLATSGASYLQGIDERYDGDTSGIGDDTCGQAISMDFIEKNHKEDTIEPPDPYSVDHPEFYSLDNFTWDRVWTYRRVKAEFNSSDVEIHDCSLQV